MEKWNNTKEEQYSNTPVLPGPDLVFKGNTLFRGRRAPGPDRDDRDDTSVQGCRARAGRAGLTGEGLGRGEIALRFYTTNSRPS